MSSIRVALWSLSFEMFASSLSYWASPKIGQSCETRSQSLVVDCPARDNLTETAASVSSEVAAFELGRTAHRGGDQEVVEALGEPATDLAREPTEHAVAAEALKERGSADEVANVIAAAVARAQASAGSDATANVDAPMTRAERDAFRMAALGCWRFESGSPAGRTTLTVGFDLDRDGRVVGEFQLLWHDAPTQDVAEQAFEAARRAILHCQGNVIPMPPKQHEQERRAELTFDPRTWTIR